MPIVPLLLACLSRIRWPKECLIWAANAEWRVVV